MMTYLVQHNRNKYYQLDTSLRRRSCRTQCNTISWKRSANAWIIPPSGSVSAFTPPQWLTVQNMLIWEVLLFKMPLTIPTQHMIHFHLFVKPQQFQDFRQLSTGAVSLFLKTIKTILRIYSVLTHSDTLGPGNKLF